MAKDDGKDGDPPVIDSDGTSPSYVDGGGEQPGQGAPRGGGVSGEDAQLGQPAPRISSDGGAPTWAEDQLRGFVEDGVELPPELLAEQQAVLLKAGDVVAGRFEIVKQLGFGGMGSVYHVRDRELHGEEKALKVMLPSLLRSDAARERFLSEVSISQKLRHERIVTVYDLDQDAERGFRFFTMEYVPGKTLHRLLADSGGRLPLKQALDIMGQVCDALAYAHRYTIHRDLKPQNIMVRPDGALKVLDFGLAKLMSPGRLTKSSMALGTAYYQAPEQSVQLKELDTRADVYSLGVILYQMLTGRIPVGHYERPSRVVGGLPKALDGVVDTCLYPEPERRYGSVEDLAATVQKAASGKKGRWLVLAGAAAVLVVVAAAWGLLAEHGRSDSDVVPVAEEQVVTGQDQELGTVPSRLEDSPRLVQSPILSAPAGRSEDSSNSSGGDADFEVETDASEDTAFDAGAAPLSAEKKGATVAQLLTQARECLKNEHLTEPIGESACDVYGRVLELDPQNVAAREGMQAIVDRHAEWATNAIKEGQYEGAQSFLHKVESVPGEKSEIRALQAMVSALERRTLVSVYAEPEFQEAKASLADLDSADQDEKQQRDALARTTHLYEEALRKALERVPAGVTVVPESAKESLPPSFDSLVEQLRDPVWFGDLDSDGEVECAYVTGPPPETLTIASIGENALEPQATWDEHDWFQVILGVWDLDSNGSLEVLTYGTAGGSGSPIELSVVSFSGGRFARTMINTIDVGGGETLTLHALEEIHDMDGDGLLEMVRWSSRGGKWVSNSWPEVINWRNGRLIRVSGRFREYYDRKLVPRWRELAQEDDMSAEGARDSLKAYEEMFGKQ